MKLLRWLAGRRRRPPVDWLESFTGRPGTFWIAWIQRRISSTWRPNPKDPKHPISRPAADWILPLITEIEEQLDTERREGRRSHGDENIGHALAAGLVLLTWALRISRAKAMDPNRPVGLRRQAYGDWLRMGAALQAVLQDEQFDPEFFPDQKWELPFLPDATDGDFV